MRSPASGQRWPPASTLSGATNTDPSRVSLTCHRTVKQATNAAFNEHHWTDRRWLPHCRLRPRKQSPSRHTTGRRVRALSLTRLHDGTALVRGPVVDQARAIRPQWSRTAARSLSCRQPCVCAPASITVTKLCIPDPDAPKEPRPGDRAKGVPGRCHTPLSKPVGHGACSRAPGAATVWAQGTQASAGSFESHCSSWCSVVARAVGAGCPCHDVKRERGHGVARPLGPPDPAHGTNPTPQVTKERRSLTTVETAHTSAFATARLGQDTLNHLWGHGPFARWLREEPDGVLFEWWSSQSAATSTLSDVRSG